VAEPRRQGALLGHLLPGRNAAPGAAPDAAPGVILEAGHPGAMAQINGAHDAAALHALVDSLGLAHAPRPLQCTPGEQLALLWNGPGQYLAVSDRHREHELAAELGAALRASAAVAVDVSHARTVLHLCGPACVEVLAQGCALDLDGMRAGQCAATVISRFNVLVHCTDDAGFDLYVTRSLAQSFFEWLCRAGAPFALEVRA
jgi:sarcosine oxidase subunit gamma